MVIVSNSTAALDIVQARCSVLGALTVRIDGATDVARRHDIVVAFNSPHSRTKVREKWDAQWREHCRCRPIVRGISS